MHDGNAGGNAGGGSRRKPNSRGELAGELRDLGRGIRLPEVDGETMAERVLAQLLAEAVPVPVAAPVRWGERVRGWLHRRWRSVLAGLSGLLVLLVLTPPVRAAVVDWFDFGGVEVRYVPSASPPPKASVPGCVPALPMATAARLAGFVPRLPGALGTPDAVSLTMAATGRKVIGVCWVQDGHTVRLDEFPASLDIGFVKQVTTMPQWLPLTLRDGTDLGNGLWFEASHLLRFRLLDGSADGWTESVRTAGPTLLWEDPRPVGGGPDGGKTTLTLRLEGVSSASRARAIAESVP